MTLKDATTDLIRLLGESSEQYVSGEYLSQCLGITRAAVWKRIAALKEEGYLIEASTKKGYRLDPSVKPYGRLAILSALSSDVFGRKLDFYKITGSTNSMLKQLAMEGAPEGTVAIADSQNQGRGRLGRTWMSAPGLGIWMSVLLRPKLHPSEVQTLTLAAAAAVCRVLEPLKIPGLGIKWPNDVLVKDKKVCGILTEMSAEGESVGWVILGIGINVNHLEPDFPDEIAPTATSLKLMTEAEKPLDRSILAARIIDELETVYKDFLKHGPLWVVNEWKKWNLTLGKRVKLLSQSGDMIATARDITPDGKLVVQCDDGKLLEILSGEISLRNA